jgi:putative hydrolase of the HAD superfamily
MFETTPEVLFFDAGGTLFEVRGSVGEAYGRIAREQGLDVDLDALEGPFRAAFGAQGPLAFPGLHGSALEAAERAWWLRVVAAVFEGRMEGARLERTFDALYAHFRRGDAWRLFPDVVPTLERLAGAGVRLGIVSNFDSRLEEILVDLGISRHFERVVISSRAGAAKPDAAIFRTALSLFGIEPERAAHVGDTPAEDVAGARAAGVHGILLDRGGRHPDWRDGPRVTTLEALLPSLR